MDLSRDADKGLLEVNMERLAESNDSPGLSMRGIVESLFRQRKLFLVAAALIFIVGMLFAFLPHKKYASEMVLLVQNARSNAVISASRTVGDGGAGEVSDSQLNSEIEVLQSNDVLDQVIDPSWSSQPASSRPAQQVKDHAAEVDGLRGRLTVTPGKKSHTIVVDYISNDPKDATETLNKVTTAFLNKERELGQPSQAPKFFSDEAERYKQEWQAAEASLVKYQQGHDLVNITDKETAMEHQLFDSDSQLRAAQVQIGELQNKMLGEALQLKTQPMRMSTTQNTTPLAGTVDSLNIQKVQLQLQRAQALAKYQPTDRIVQLIDQQLHQVDDSLAQVATMNSTASATNLNPTWMAADQALSTDRALLKATEGRRDGLQAQVKDLQAKLGSTEGMTVEFNALQQKVTELEANYVLYLQKRDESLANSSMDVNGLLNVAVVQAPTYSLDAVRPRPQLDTLLAIFTALFIGLFAVFAAESMRDTFANAQELEATGGTPVFATVPFDGARMTLPPPRSPDIIKR